MADPTYTTDIRLASVGRTTYARGSGSDGTYFYVLASPFTGGGEGDKFRLFRIRVSDGAIVGPNGTVYTDPTDTNASTNTGINQGTYSQRIAPPQVCGGEVVFGVDGTLHVYSASTMAAVTTVSRQTIYSGYGSCTDGTYIYFQCVDGVDQYLEQYTPGTHAYSATLMSYSEGGASVFATALASVGSEIWIRNESKAYVAVINPATGVGTKYDVQYSPDGSGLQIFAQIAYDGTYVYIPSYQYITKMRASDKAYIMADGSVGTGFWDALTTVVEDQYCSGIAVDTGILYVGITFGWYSPYNGGGVARYRTSDMVLSDVVGSVGPTPQKIVVAGDNVFSVNVMGDNYPHRTTVSLFSKAPTGAPATPCPPCPVDGEALVNAFPTPIAEADVNGPPIPTGAGAKVT